MEWEIIEELNVEYPDRKKFFVAVGLLLAGKISLGKSADFLGLRVDEMMELLDKSGIKYDVYNDEEVEKELKSYEEVFSD